MNRARAWSLILYPDSLPKDFEQVIRSWLVPALMSPLHDPKLNEDLKDNEQKRHYHLGLFFDSPKSYDQVLDLATQLNTKVVSRINVIRSYCRYLIHLDDKDKQQADCISGESWSIHDLVPFNGCQYLKYFETDLDENAVFFCQELERIIFDTRIDNLVNLVQFLELDDRQPLADYLRFNNCFYISCLLKSMADLNKRNMVTVQEFVDHHGNTQQAYDEFKNKVSSFSTLLQQFVK